MQRLVLFTLSTLAAVATLKGAESYDKTTPHGHRSKRYFFINPDSPISIGFLLNLPISLALPTLVDTSARSFSEYDQHIKLPGEEYPDDLYWEPSYEKELGTMEVYFSYLKIPTVACQERLVCELAASLDTYSPLSALMLKELRQTHGPVKPSKNSLFWRFMAASATGYAYSEEDCEEYYSQCGLAAKRQLNMPVLKVWQYLASKLNLKLV